MEDDRAPQACTSCRKQKRKCDKSLPQCSLCTRHGRACEYVEPADEAPTAEDFTALKQDLTDLKRQIAGLNGHTPVALDSPGSSNDAEPPSFPSLFFLDNEIFEYDRRTIQKPHVPVPDEIVSALGSPHVLQELVEAYFDNVHHWLPIVSRTRLYQALLVPTSDLTADVALLLLSMKLIRSNQEDGRSSQNAFYRLVRYFYAFTESQNAYSLQFLQSLILIATYEYGNAIYPAAYMTIGQCARLGYALGVHDNKTPQLLPNCTTWTEQEERRRVWWAVLILDRVINVGIAGRPFATRDPSLDSKLPCDDTAWKRGEVNTAPPLALSASSAVVTGSFARTCQASHLLGRVLEHRNDLRMSSEFRYQEAIALERSLSALSSVFPERSSDVHNEKHNTTAAVAICYSGLLTLYDLYSCPDKIPDGAPEEHLLLQQASVDGLLRVSGRVAALADKISNQIRQKGVEYTNPFVLDALYQAAANCESQF